MTVSDCCGVAIKVEYRPDHPFVYDDPYVLQIPVLICSKCGRVLGLNPTATSEDEKQKES